MNAREFDLFEKFFETSPVAFLIWDAQGETVHANSSYLSLFSDEAVPDNIFLEMKACARGETRNFPTFSVQKAGERRHVQGKGQPLEILNGHPTYVAFLFRDITQELETLNKLKQSEIFLERAQEVGRMGSWISGIENDNSLVWSKQVYQIFGLKESEFKVSVDGFYSRVHPDDRDSVRQAVFEAITTGRPYAIDHRIILPTGDVRWVHERGRLVELEDGVPRLMGVVQDISESRELEQQFRQAQKLEAVGRLAGGIAHDFSNILSTIFLYAERLENALKGHAQYNDIQAIRKTAERAARLTRQLLVFGKQQMFSVTPMSINQILTDMRDMLEEMVGEKVSIRYHLDSKLPPVLGDLSQVEQLVMNLVLNSRDAMAEGGVIDIYTESISISEEFIQQNGLDLESPGKFIQLRVKDSGRGIPSQNLQQIFDPFFTTKPVGQGTGLGLSVVYGALRQMRGDLIVQSEPGKGATFTLYFPVASPSELPSENRAPDRARTPADRARILLVEDEDDLREVIATVLTQQGYEIVSCDGAAKAEHEYSSRDSSTPAKAWSPIRACPWTNSIV